jgi:phospholipase/carboxylesterase
MTTPLQGPARLLPATTKAEYLVVFLHGLGADGNDLLGLADSLASALPPADFLSPHAPFPCDIAPFGYQWFSLQDWSPSSILAGVKKATPILNQFLDDELQKRGLPPERLILVGFSQGTMISLYVALRRASAIGAVIGFSGALIGGETLAAEITARPPIFLCHGMMDTVVPYAAMPAAEAVLRFVGCDTVTITRPHLAHGIDEVAVKEAGDFLRRTHGRTKT